MKAILAQEDNESITVSESCVVAHKSSLLWYLERDDQVYTELVPDCTKATLQAVMMAKVSIDDMIYSDGNGLVDVGYD